VGTAQARLCPPYARAADDNNRRSQCSLKQTLVPPAVADHAQTIVVEPTAAQADLATAGWKRPAADGTTLNLRRVRTGAVADLSVRILGKRADLCDGRLRDQGKQQRAQNRNSAASHTRPLSCLWMPAPRLFPAVPARSMARQFQARAAAATRGFPCGVFRPPNVPCIRVRKGG
jgi:hypothetical protein